MPEPSEVRSFYDDFSKRVLARDFYYLNRRHEAIKDLCSRYVPPGSTVLEVGCGVGIITRYLKKTASRIVAVDISPKNIEIAREYAGPGVQFEVMDITAAEPERHGPFDAILLADVIEHIAKPKHRDVFARLEKSLTDGGRIILTYPSPEVQAHMRARQPHDVQVIDESIEHDELLAATTLKPLYFAYKDIFGRNDYVHAVFCRKRVYSDLPAGESAGAWLASRVKKYLWRLGNLGFLRRLKGRGLVD